MLTKTLVKRKQEPVTHVYKNTYHKEKRKPIIRVHKNIYHKKKMSREERKRIKKRWKQHKRREKKLLDRYRRGTLYGITVTEADLLEQREQRVKPKPCPNCKEDLIQDFCDLCDWNTKTDIIYKK